MTKTLTLRSGNIPSAFQEFHRAGIGFDSMFDELLRISNHQNQTNYPPHNIVKITDDSFAIEVAVSGFTQGEIEIKLDNRVLTIHGTKSETTTAEYLHKGISTRDFVREFTLAEHVEVVSATQKDGILTIQLERIVPEEKRPKLIDIKYSK